MDASQQSTNGIHSTTGSYPSPPPAVTPNHLSQHNSPLPQPQHTLPPLQPQTAAMNQMYGSNPHTPRTPATPNTPNSAAPPNPNTAATVAAAAAAVSNGHANQQQQQQQQQQQHHQNSNGGPMSNNQQYHQAGRGAPYQQMPASYPPPPQGYPATSGMMPQTTMAPSHPQPIAPAPAGGRVPPNLRPMPPGGVMPQPGVQSPYGPGGLMQQLPDDGQPTHVVGSQGRRGILPSAPGRPAAPQAGTGGTKNTVIPQKDADGKFPCPHCTKTYLHAKHLKRHLLRHTGDRPYMCVLCRDTFSRSDILKRHFQKCSIRRGNPTGASHLSHPQAHVKKNQQAQQKAAALGQDGDLSGHLNGLNSMPSADGMVQPFGMMPQVGGDMSNLANDQNQLSRSSSMGRMDNGNNQDRRNMPGMGGNQQPYNGDVSNQMPQHMQQQMPNYNMPGGQNGMPAMYGGSQPSQHAQPNSALDWSQMFPPDKRP